MQGSYRHTRPTIGVLAGGCTYTGTLQPYWEPLLRGIQTAVRERDCNLLLACGMEHAISIAHCTAWPILSPDTDFLPVGPWNTDGLLVLNPLFEASEEKSRYIQELRAAGYPLVFAGTGEEGPTVAVDNAGGIRQALAHLVAHGHRRIAFIAGIEEMGDSRNRLCAYQTALQEFGLVADPRLIAYGKHHSDCTRTVIGQLLGAGVEFTAVLASNDMSALGAVQGLREAGLRVPQDVAVVGFDDLVEAEGQRLPLTSIHAPVFEIGYQAATLLHSYITGEKTTIERISLPTRLAIRESCGCQPDLDSATGIRLSASTTLHTAPTTSQYHLYDIQEIAVQAMRDVLLERMRYMRCDTVEMLCQQLVQHLIVSLKQRDEAPFLGMLKETLEHVEEAEDDADPWQAAISTLHNHLLYLIEAHVPDANTRTLLNFADDMLHRARMLISKEVQHRFHRSQVVQRERVNLLGKITALLHAALDEAQILKIVNDYFPRLGIQNALVVFYEAEKDDPVAWGRVRSGLADVRAELRFPTRSFPPESCYPHEPFRLALLPLLPHDDAIGFVAFDAADLTLCAIIVWQLAAALQNAQLYRMKNRFLSVVSHELRTPLNLIVGLSEILLREEEQTQHTSTHYLQDVKRIHDSSQHLGRLIRDVLDLTSSEVGQLRLSCEQLHPDEIFQVAADTGARLAQEKGLEWRCAIPPSLPLIWGDRTRLQQVALNLINNAIKFTSQGWVALTISHANQQITLAVSDSGLGVPLIEQSAIFDEFRQSERSSERGYGGLGLGLAICKQLVQLHNGQIGVQSSGIEGMGSTFYFSLPTLEHQESFSGEIWSTPQDALLLTASEEHGKQLHRQLAQRGVNVAIHIVRQAEDVRQRVLALLPRVIVLDVQVFAHHGVKLLKELKEHASTQGIPLLFTSSTQTGEVNALLEVDYLAKPININGLAQVLAQHTQQATGNQSAEKTILIVDDDAETLEMHARMIQMQPGKYRVHKASNGREAIELLRQDPPDLVLLDLMMPEMSGFTVLEMMQRDEHMRSIPVIVLTAQILTETDMRRLNGGMTTVLSKGVLSMNETLHQIDAVLSRRRTGSEAQHVIHKAITYLHLHYREPLTRDQVARYVGVSEGHLSRCFQQELGMAPMTYLNRYRINRAKQLLATPRRSITEVALAVGFSDSNHLGRAFRREVGLAPSEYQREVAVQRRQQANIQ